MEWSSQLNDPKLWVALISAIVAVSAYIRAGRALKVQKGALQINLDQEERKRSKLRLEIEKAQVRSFPSQRIYCFCFTISNESDSNNSITNFTLLLEHETAGGLRTPLQIPASDTRPDALAVDLPEPLELPENVGARESIRGWTYFDIPKEVLDNRLIRRYRLSATDTHRTTYSDSAIILMEVSG